MKCPPLQVFLATEFFYGDHFTIEGRQKVTFWNSELEALHNLFMAITSVLIFFWLRPRRARIILRGLNGLHFLFHFLYSGSCSEVKKMWPGFKDDEYVIQMTPSCNPVRLYCHGLNTATPREYITLPAGPDRNYASFHRGRLLNFESCSGTVNPEPKLTANYWGTTR